MKCENVFCIYWADKSCQLDDISLDIQGNCQSCIYIELSEKMLLKKRKSLLNSIKLNSGKL